MYVKSKRKSKIGHRVFEINMGIRQGDTMFPILFKLVINEALSKASNTQWGAKIGESTNVLTYAVDVKPIAEKMTSHIWRW